MKKLKQSAIVLFFLIFTTTAWANQEADNKAVIKVLDDYGEFNLAGDAKSWAELHATDVVKLRQDKPPLTSWDELYEGKLKTNAKRKVVGWDLEIKEIEILGDRAYTWGVYEVELQFIESGDTVRANGKFLTLYRKEPDGRWVITHDMSNSSVSPKK